MNTHQLITPIEARRRSLISRVIVFVILVALALTSLVALNSWHAYKNKLKENEVSTSNMSRALAQHAEATILSTDNIVAALVESIEEKGFRTIDHSRLHAFLMRRVAEQSIAQLLIVVDAKGKPIVNSRPKLLAGVNYLDRDYFIHHRDYADRGPYIGRAVRSKTTGDWIITVSRRLQNEDGSFAGLVVATIPLDFFRMFYDEFDIGNSGVIFLATDEATMLVRRPFIEKVIGSSIAKGPVFNEYRTKGPSGTAMLVSMIDGTERLYSYRHLETYPLLVAVALSKEDIFEEWRSETYRLVAACFVLVTLVAAFGTYLILQINQREDTEEKLRQAKEQLEAMAAQDSLTGLPNRRLFDSALKSEFERATRNRSWLALIMVDVDKFKQFNDLYGHPTGDECLQSIAEAIKSIPSRPADLAARYGGEEMVVLLPDTDQDGAAIIAERLRAAVESLNIPHKANQGGVVTISLGLMAVRPSTYTGTASNLINLADHALYAAKAAGRNQLCIGTSTEGNGT